MTEVSPQENSIERLYDLPGAYSDALAQFDAGDSADALVRLEKSLLTANEVCPQTAMHARLLIAWSACKGAAMRPSSETPEIRHDTLETIIERLRDGLKILESTRQTLDDEVARDIDGEMSDAQMLIKSFESEYAAFSTPKPRHTVLPIRRLNDDRCIPGFFPDGSGQYD